jgi:thiol-disulfide isomerase/thioredoxin
MKTLHSFPIVFSPLLACLLLAVTNVRALDSTELIGQPGPVLRESGLEGRLPELTGRVVLLDFWASWCPPCAESFPAMAALQMRFAARGLVIVAVSVDTDPRACARFVERMRPPFSVVRDPQQRLAASLAAPAMPTSLLIDRRGVVRFRHDGYRGRSTDQAYVGEIEQLLAEPPP